MGPLLVFCELISINPTQTTLLYVWDESRRVVSCCGACKKLAAAAMQALEYASTLRSVPVRGGVCGEFGVLTG